MKSLNLARPHILLVVGNPGAGKSFFARQFSATFGAPVVCYNRIRSEVFGDPSYSRDENYLVDRLAAYQIEELLKTGRTFMIDGGGNARAERVRLAQMAKKAGYGLGVIWVQTDLPTCRMRAQRRNLDKSPDDEFNPAMTEPVFAMLARRFTEPIREDHVVISGKHTYNTQAKAVLRKLVVVREAEANAAHHQGLEQSRQALRRPDTFSRSAVARYDSSNTKHAEA
jgi:predicted kinase